MTAGGSQGERSLAHHGRFIHFNAQMYEHLNQRQMELQIVSPYGDIEEGFSFVSLIVRPGTVGQECFEYGDGTAGRSPVEGTCAAPVG